MNIEDKIQNIRKLILKAKHRSLDENEQRELTRWINESEENEKVYNKLTDETLPMEDLQRYIQATRLNDWDELQKKIIYRKRRINLRRFSTYAATLILALSAVYFLREIADNKKSQENQLSYQILPVKRFPTLEIENQDKILLANINTENLDQLNKRGIELDQKSLMYNEDNTLEVENHTLIVPRGCEYILTLSDGTKVWINSESTLKYPSNFNGEERRVELEGEAYFKVAKNTIQPFVVYASEIDVRVTGTEFNIMAYKSKGRIETTLVEGSVNVSNSFDIITLTPNTQAVFVKEDNSLTTRKVHTQLYTSWKDGVFEFYDFPLWEIAEQLERWYDIQFQFKTEDLKEIRFTGAAKKMNPITSILEAIKDTKAINYNIEENIIEITKR